MAEDAGSASPRVRAPPPRSDDSEIGPVEVTVPALLVALLAYAFPVLSAVNMGMFVLVGAAETYMNPRKRINVRGIPVALLYTSPFVGWGVWCAYTGQVGEYMGVYTQTFFGALTGVYSCLQNKKN